MKQIYNTLKKDIMITVSDDSRQKTLSTGKYDSPRDHDSTSLTHSNGIVTVMYAIIQLL